MKYDLLIFDCDGTLVDSETLLNRALSRALTELDFTQYTEEFCIAEFTGQSSDYVDLYLKQRHPEIPTKELEEKFLEIAAHLVPLELTEMPGAMTCLENLISINKCVVSNGFNTIVKYALEVANLKKYFPDDVIFTYDIIGKPKPDPAMLIHAAKYFSVPQQRCLVLEDSVVGIQAAAAAGMDVLVVYPYTNHLVEEAAKQANTLGFIKDLREIQRYLK